MSQYLAFLISAGEPNTIELVERAALAVGYRVEKGIEAGDPEVVSGLRRFCSYEPELVEAVYIVTNSDNRDAYEIYQELLFCRSRAEQPKFFKFLSSLEVNVRDGIRYMVSCEEWRAEDEAVYLEGTIQDLQSYLKVAGTLGLWFWSPQHGTVQGSSRYPILFKIFSG